MSNDSIYTLLLDRLKETKEMAKFLSSCIKEMENGSSLSTTSKTGIRLRFPYHFKKVEITIDNIQYIKNVSGDEYSLKFKSSEYPVRINESWIALVCFKYERDDD